jgi:hypothetical protein
VKLLSWFKERGFTTGVTDSQDAMFACLARPDGKTTWPSFIRRSSGKIETTLQYLKNDSAIASKESRLNIIDTLNSLPGITVETNKSTGWPALPLEALSQDAVWAGFIAVAERVQRSFEPLNDAQISEFVLCTITPRCSQMTRFAQLCTGARRYRVFNATAKR